MKCLHCKSEGRDCELVDTKVAVDFAKHLRRTKGYPLMSSYLHCKHCGEYYLGVAVDPTERERVKAEVRAEMEKEALEREREANPAAEDVVAE